eukprot:TRINITY_DN1434_c0_g1_i1.p1 TRINITY_DN1434_c0_g1~~TRINITY_DN1434_c0_g1_i1.p1  ORF type:complete len:146 (-),score=8.34 TRINITY_DN1434_c0_g1_i1:1005-1442(-)
MCGWDLTVNLHISLDFVVLSELGLGFEQCLFGKTQRRQGNFEMFLLRWVWLSSYYPDLLQFGPPQNAKVLCYGSRSVILELDHLMFEMGLPLDIRLLHFQLGLQGLCDFLVHYLYVHSFLLVYLLSSACALHYALFWGLRLCRSF